jgi:hypothetical protein
MLKYLSKGKIDVAQELSSTETHGLEEAISYSFARLCFYTIWLGKKNSLGASCIPEMRNRANTNLT